MFISIDLDKKTWLNSSRYYRLKQNKFLQIFFTPSVHVHTHYLLNKKASITSKQS